LLISFCAQEKKYFGEYLSEVDYAIITLKPDHTFISRMEVHGMVFNNSGTFDIELDTILLNYKDGKIDSAGGPPRKNLWRRKKLYYINEGTGEINKMPYARRIKPWRIYN
jgi:hypothetical protein